MQLMYLKIKILLLQQNSKYGKFLKIVSEKLSLKNKNVYSIFFLRFEMERVRIAEKYESLLNKVDALEKDLMLRYSE